MTAKNSKSTLKTTTEELRALMKDAETLLADAGGDDDSAATAQVTDLRERIGTLLSQSRDRLARVRESAREHLGQADDYVRTHPYHAVGVAAGVGAVIGLLVSSRRSAS